MIQTACNRKDCCYHTEHAQNYGCNYMFVNGFSKHSQMPYGETYTVENCPFYEKGRRKKPNLETPLPNGSSIDVIKDSRTINSDTAEMLMDMKLSDYDIAMFLRVTQAAFAKWRRNKGYYLQRGKKYPRINWGEVDAMLKDGYSDVAVAVYNNTTENVISYYKEFKKNGGKTEHAASEVQADYL